MPVKLGSDRMVQRHAGFGGDCLGGNADDARVRDREWHLEGVDGLEAGTGVLGLADGPRQGGDALREPSTPTTIQGAVTLMMSS